MQDVVVCRDAQKAFAVNVQQCSVAYKRSGLMPVWGGHGTSN